MNTTTLLPPALKAVSDACAVCREVQRSLEKVRSITKDDKSPVTVADFASQAIVGHRLTQALGRNVVMVGEEGTAFLRSDDSGVYREAVVAAVTSVWPDASEADVLNAIDVGGGDTHHGSFWTLDPVDGTKGFLRGQQYAIALAYIERGIPVLGVLGCPNLPKDFSSPLDEADPVGCLYFAVRGDGLYEVPCDEPSAKPLRIRRLDREPGEAISVCESVESGHSKQDDTARIMAMLGPSREPARLDSQCKYAVVARGQADAYLRLPTKKDYVERIWDHAAGSLVAAEGGAEVTDIHGRALEFTHGRGLEKNKGIVCAPPSVHARVIAAIKQLGIGSP